MATRIETVERRSLKDSVLVLLLLATNNVGKNGPSCGTTNLSNPNLLSNESTSSSAEQCRAKAPVTIGRWASRSTVLPLLLIVILLLVRVVCTIPRASLYLLAVKVGVTTA